MKNKDQMLSQQNELDNLIRQSFGYSDEQLVEEFDRLEIDVKSERSYGPKYEYILILDRLKRERSMTKVIRFRRLAKVSVLVAVMLVGISVWGMPVIAKFRYKFFSKSQYGKENQVIWNNTKRNLVGAFDEQETAYLEIENVLGIPVLRLGYIPLGLKFLKLNINDISATIMYDYNGYNVWITQSGVSKATSKSVVSDRVVYKKIYNKYLQKDLNIRKNELDKDIAEYDVMFALEDVYYSITAIMEEEEFEMMVTEMFIVKTNKQ